jgi:hypothetical protein
MEMDYDLDLPFLLVKILEKFGHDCVIKLSK